MLGLEIEDRNFVLLEFVEPVELHTNVIATDEFRFEPTLDWSLNAVVPDERAFEKGSSEKLRILLGWRCGSLQRRAWVTRHPKHPPVDYLAACSARFCVAQVDNAPVSTSPPLAFDAPLLLWFGATSSFGPHSLAIG